MTAEINESSIVKRSAALVRARTECIHGDSAKDCKKGCAHPDPLLSRTKFGTTVGEEAAKLAGESGWIVEVHDPVADTHEPINLRELATMTGIAITAILVAYEAIKHGDDLKQVVLHLVRPKNRNGKK